MNSNFIAAQKEQSSIMDESFILTVQYKLKEQDFTAWLLLQGFTHKIKVLINETEVFFEPDEEGQYRAVKMSWQEQKDLEKIDKVLLSQIQQKIQDIVK
jgi:hypothetical protein